MPDEHRIHLHLYGIRNCDSCRSAMKWLETRRVPFTFHSDGEAILDIGFSPSHLEDYI